MFLTSCIPPTPHTQGSDWDYLLPSSAESRPNTSVSILVPPSAPSPPCCLLPSTHPGAMPSLQGAHGAMLQTFPIHPPSLPTRFFCLSWQKQHAGCSITLHQQGRCARDAPQGEPADQCSSFAHHCPGLTWGHLKDTTRADISQGCPQTPAEIRSQSALLR